MERKLIGLVLIVVGVLFALGTTDILEFSWAMLWPLILLVQSVIFHVSFFMSGGHPSKAGQLVPAGILFVLSLLFLSCNIFGWDILGSLWPVFLLAPALGLFELYLFGGRNQALLIPVLVLTIVALAFLGFNMMSGVFGSVLGVILVLAGLYVLFAGKKKKDSFF